MQAKGLELQRLALHAYSYLHLPMVAGIVLFALGLETTLHHLDEALDTVPAVALCGGAALYLLAEIAFLSEPAAESSGGGRSGRSCCSPSSRLLPRSRRSRRSPSSAPSARSLSPTRRSRVESTASRSGTPNSRTDGTKECA